ncbi:MAG: thermonuclease family protein, partial [Dehalococcoidales bacterium]|nr:thermonuclease family protein [Dehalococcoidales bacterium]
IPTIIIGIVLWWIRDREQLDKSEKSQEPYEARLIQWEAEGYDVSEFREKWLPAKKTKTESRKYYWLAIALTIVVLPAAFFILQVWQEVIPVTVPTPSPAPAPETTTTPIVPSPQVTEVTVVRVIDGDTIEVDIGGKLYKVRYIGVDTPEVGQPGGTEATSVNTELVTSRVVQLEKDISETDRYGRLLRYVWVDEIIMVNAALVASGYAQVATYPPDVKYQQYFLELQRKAEVAGLGLWVVSQPIPATEGVFVGSINSDVYHYPACEYAQRINPENQMWLNSPADTIAQGYRPCKRCDPP